MLASKKLTFGKMRATFGKEPRVWNTSDLIQVQIWNNQKYNHFEVIEQKVGFMNDCSGCGPF